MSAGLPPVPYPFKLHEPDRGPSGPRCLMCGYHKDQHTTGYCDYTMAPGDKPEKFLSTWTKGNPYTAEPERAREWERVYAEVLRDLEGT